jgi:eukaryotic-like serine/threonine-protein kinase
VKARSSLESSACYDPHAMTVAVPTGRAIAGGRYLLFDEIGAGGMATLHVGRLVGRFGFAKIVAIKRLHPNFAKDEDFVKMFLDEAKLAARISHPNVVATLEVLAEGDELFLVMDYVAGESLARLLCPPRSNVPPAIASAVLVDVLHGLHAAHEAVSAQGDPLHLVHRDVSPQNILVGADGIARLIDFGVAKAVGRSRTTTDGRVLGKPAYMSPEQLSGQDIDRRTDIFAAAIVLWEALCGERLFAADSPTSAWVEVLGRAIEPPSLRTGAVSPELDAVVMRGLARDRGARFETARDMAAALEAACPPASAAAVADWVRSAAEESLRRRAAVVSGVERAAESSASSSAKTTDLQAEAKTRARPPTRRWLFGAAAAVALGGVVAAGWRVARSSRPAPARASAEAVPEQDTPPVVPDPAAPPPTTTAGPPARKQPSTATRPAGTAPKQKAAASCDPPYRIDSDGIRLWKPYCPR